VGEEELRKAGQAVRLIVCDLDGTLLNSRKQISSENLAAIRDAQAKGIFVTFCSGRVHTMLEAYTRLLDIRGPVVTANGAVIVDTRTGEMPYRNCADRDRVYPLLRFCRERGLDVVVVGADGCWYAPGSKRIARFEQYNEIARRDALPPLPLRRFDPDFQETLKGDIYKVLVAGLSPEAQAQVEAEARSIGGLSVTSSEGGLVDIGASGIDKGQGVRLLAELLGLEKRKICVLGDYQNDIPMFVCAGLPIAMGNAGDEVKRHARAVTAANDDDGVARAVRRYIL
jgi:Cof subfamily protein (haloacid dehalogenase superfamily)